MQNNGRSCERSLRPRDAKNLNLPRKLVMQAQHSHNLPTPSVQRLPSYLRLIKSVRECGETAISCTRIAEEFGQTSVQVRKDLAITGITGRPKIGYQIADLVEAIEEFLGWNVTTHAFLVGVGNLGSAILNYEGFASHGLNVVDVFDANPKLLGTVVNGRVIRPVADIPERAKILREKTGKTLDMGVITAPAHAAQSVADLLVRAGARAIWNYAPIQLELPDDVVCENVKLSESFAVLTNRMRMRRHRVSDRAQS